jgi:hypothetical protein
MKTHVKLTNYVNMEVNISDRIPIIKFSQIFIFCVIIFILVLPRVIQGKDTGLKDVVPDNEKRSCIQTIDGYAYLSEDMTLSETRKAAFANAKRQAVENTRTYIISNTTVEDLVVKKDTIKGTAEGAVTILKQKDFGIEDNKRYHVWIMAEVEYELETKGQQMIQEHDLDIKAPLTVKVWTSKKIYRDGENIKIFVQGKHDFYARIIDITSRGEIIQLLPNDYRSIDFFEAGKVYKIPDKGDHFHLKVAPPYGKNKIVVYASEVPLGNVSMELAGQGLRSFKGSLKTLAEKSRGVAIVSKTQKTGSGAQFYEGTWTLKTVR